MKKSMLSAIIPVYNEEGNLSRLYDKLKEVLDAAALEYEMIFVNDGSSDASQQALEGLAAQDERVRVIEFSRNFGKEEATTAGLHHSKGEAAIMIDADLQHPPEMIPEFLAKWKGGAEVVVGVRQNNAGAGPVKKVGSYFFNKIINKISDVHVVPGATDYRLLDRVVIDEFNRLTERNRITRGLIDWLGFRRDYVHFDAAPRQAGDRPTYSFIKLVRLAFNSIVSLSLLPLRLAGYLGIFIIIISGGFGLYILAARHIFESSFALSFSGSAQLAILIVFLVGIILSCLGLIALYVANIHQEVIDRPLYVVRPKKAKNDQV